MGRTRRSLQSQSDLPHRGGRLLRVALLTPQSFGALPLRLGATMRPTASGRLLSVTDAVTFDTTDARPSVPTKGYTSRFDTTDARDVRPYKSLHISVLARI